MSDRIVGPRSRLDVVRSSVRSRLVDRLGMARALNSLPVPLGPSIRTVLSLSAICGRMSNTVFDLAYSSASTNDPEGDPDSDGLSNREECAAGANPLAFETDGDGMGDRDELLGGTKLADPTERLAMDNLERVTWSTFEFDVLVRPGRTYQVQRCPRLGAP